MRSVVGRCVCNVVTIIILVPAVAVVSDATVTICTTRFNFPLRTNFYAIYAIQKRRRISPI